MALTRKRRTLQATCLWSSWYSATMKWIQLVPSLVDHFRPGDDFEVTLYRRTGATWLTNEMIATCYTDATFQTTSPVSG